MLRKLAFRFRKFIARVVVFPTLRILFRLLDSLRAGRMRDAGLLLRGEKSIGAGGIDPLDGIPLEELTGRLTLRGSEKLGADTLESFART